MLFGGIWLSVEFQLFIGKQSILANHLPIAWEMFCYGTDHWLPQQIVVVIAAQEKRFSLHRSDLQNPLKINFSAVFE